MLKFKKIGLIFKNILILVSDRYPLNLPGANQTIFYEEVIQEEPVMTLNDLLDKIKEKGIDSLSANQLKQLENYSKQII